MPLVFAGRIVDVKFIRLIQMGNGKENCLRIGYEEKKGKKEDRWEKVMFTG